jgi:DNA-binding MarR family transcriptional regulator
MDIDLTDDEIFNLILVTIIQVQDKLPFSENGVELKFLANNLDMEINMLKKCIQELTKKQLVTWHHDQSFESNIYIKPTEKTLENFEKHNTLTISETAEIVLEKSYDFYKRSGYDSSIQLSSNMIGIAAGFNNMEKVQSAIELLESKGYIKNPAVMLGNTIYFLSAKGISMIENKTDKKSVNSSPVTLNYIDNKNGNVSINSNNVNQIINPIELAGYFEKLENLITENLKNKEKDDALDDLETVKELAKSTPQKKHLIQKVLNNLDKIPILIEVVKQIREFFN